MRHILNSLGMQFFAKIFATLASSCVGVLIARYLGPVDFGKINYAASLIAILAPLGGIGSLNSLRVFLSAPNPLHGLVGSAFCIQIFGSIVLSALLIPFAFLQTDRSIMILILFG